MFIFVVNGITVLYCIIFRVFIREGRSIPNSYFYLGGGGGRHSLERGVYQKVNVY